MSKIGLNLPEDGRQEQASGAIAGDSQRLRTAGDDRPPKIGTLIESLGYDPEDLATKEEECLDAIRWPQGIRCPQAECGSANVQVVENGKPMPYRCRKCRKHFSRTTGTKLSSSKIGDLKLVLACHALAAHYPNVTNGQMADWLKVDKNTTRRLSNMYQTVVAGNQPEPTAGAQSVPVGTEPLALTRTVLAALLGSNDSGADCAGESKPQNGLDPYWNQVLPRLDPFRRNPVDATKRRAARKPDRKTAVSCDSALTARKTAGGMGEVIEPTVQVGATSGVGTVCSQPLLLPADPGRPKEPEPAATRDFGRVKATNARAAPKENSETTAVATLESQGQRG